MKKLVSRVLTTVLASAMILTSLPVYAANEQYSSSVTAEVESSYIVSIPKSIELDVNSIGVGTGNYTCYAYGSIDATSSVSVIPNSQFTLYKDSSDKTVTATISQDKTKWNYTDMSSESPVIGNGNIFANGLTAGNWDGKFYFNIEKSDDSADSESNTADEVKEIELVDGEVIDAGTFTLGRTQVGAVQLSYLDEDVTYDAEYTSDNTNITVNENGIINTDNATGGETAKITVEYTPASTESISLMTIDASETNSSTLSAYFTVQVIDIEFDKDTLTLYQGDTATITASVIPEEIDGTVKWQLSGLDFGSAGNTITINVAEDATPGNYVLVASYGSYMQSLNIKIAAKHVHDYGTGTITTNPTCLESGIRTFTCSCGDSYTEVEAALGHNFVDGVCARCGEKDPDAVTYVTLRSTASESKYTAGFLGSSTLGQGVTRNYIIEISFLDYEDTESHYWSDTNVWDASNAQDKSVMAWYTRDSLNNCYYIYIAPAVEGAKLKAPKNCSYMFANLKNYSSQRPVVSGIEKVDFSATTNTDYFCYDSSFEEFTLPTDLKVIGSYAFKDVLHASELKTITIPDGVTTIGENAFEKCALLTSINIPSSVTTIGNKAFLSCAGLTSIAIPDSVTAIGNSAFASCSTLASATIPNSITTIGSSTFSNCKNLTAIEIPNSTTSIGDRAFYKCTSLADVTIPSSVTSIGGQAFTDTPWMTARQAENPLVIINNILVDATTVSGDIEIPSTIIDIPSYAFYNCTGLTSVTVPKGITSIKTSTFSGCTSLTNITLPDGITSLEGNAFYKCTSLTNIELPNSLTTIGSNTFSDCTGLTGIELPSSTTTLGSYAFYKCTSLAGITIPESVTTIEGGVFNGCASLGSIVLPSKIATLESFLFRDCSALTSVNIPDGVTEIDSSAFRGCSSLTSITVPTSVTTIGDNAFTGCTGLTDLVIPSSVSTINTNAFKSVPHVTYTGSASGSPWGATSIN